MSDTELFKFLVNQRGFAFSKPGAPVVDPAGTGRLVGPHAGGKKAGDAVFAVVQITDKNGKVVDRSVAAYFGGSDKHAEAQALENLERALAGRKDLEGGELLVVVDQDPCPPNRRDCAGKIQEFARKFKLKPRVRVPTRHSVAPGAKPGTLVKPRTAAMGAQRTDLPEVELQDFTREEKADPPRKPRPVTPAASKPVKASSQAKAALTEANAGGLLGSLAGKIGALDAAQLYLDMHAAHFAALEKVSERAAIAKDLLARVAEFEDGARTLRTAINEAAAAESGLPDDPFAASPTSSFVVTQEELASVNEYYAAAAQIAGKAMAARVRLARIIQGWDGVLFQAGQTGDFTRDSAFKATTELDLRFHKDGAGFRAFLVNARDQAHVVANRARAKQSLAADILSKPEPTGWALPEAGPYSEEIRQAQDEVVAALNFNEFSNSLDLRLGARVSANWSNYPLAATGLRTALERWRSNPSLNLNDPVDIQNEYYNLMAVEAKLYSLYEIVGMLKTSVEKKTVKGGLGLLGTKLAEAISQMNTSLYAARDYYTDAEKAILYQERYVQAHYKALILRFRELGGSANSVLVPHPSIPEDEVKTAPLDKFRINWKSSTAL